jgi:hypothetical protein
MRAKGEQNESNMRANLYTNEERKSKNESNDANVWGEDVSGPTHVANASVGAVS